MSELNGHAGLRRLWQELGLLPFLGFEGKQGGYFIMFCCCGVAYILAWTIMKLLVPKYKPVEM